jgi:pimeloyl-ACP methyl ester carboxylesterase
LAMHLPRHRGAELGVAALVLLAASALETRRRELRAERENPPEGRFVEVDGVRLHLVDTGGEGPVVALIHGNGSMIADWRASGLIDRLCDRFRVVAFDRPGYGHSERPRDRLWTPWAQARLMLAALDRLGARRPLLLGHSWGTLPALAGALLRPAELGGLVLLSGYYFPTARPDAALFAPNAVPVLGDALRHTVSPLLARAMLPRMLRKVFAPRPVPEAFLRAYSFDMASRPLPLRASAEEAQMMTPAASHMKGRYGSLNLPVAIVAGSEDRIVDPEAHARALHRAMPSSDLRLLPGEGHMLHHHAAEAVVAALERVAERAALRG